MVVLKESQNSMTHYTREGLNWWQPRTRQPKSGILPPNLNPNWSMRRCFADRQYQVELFIVRLVGSRILDLDQQDWNLLLSPVSLLPPWIRLGNGLVPELPITTKDEVKTSCSSSFHSYHAYPALFYSLFSGESLPTLIWLLPPILLPDINDLHELRIQGHGCHVKSMLPWQHFDQ